MVVTDFATEADVKVANVERREFEGTERVPCLQEQTAKLLGTHEYPVKYTIYYPSVRGACSLKADMARPRLTLSGGDHRHQEGESRLLNFPMRESSLNNSAGLVKRSTGFLASSGGRGLA